MWYFRYLHLEENTDGWKIKIKDSPKDDVGELEAYIQKCYREILGREADIPGLQNYVSQINSEQVKREWLPNILKSSEEYKAKHRW